VRLGILGGTFDPIHYGHLRIAEEACEELHLEKVLMIPGATPPHKGKMKISPFEDRFAMAVLAAKDSPLLEVLDLEGRREGPSYSVDTLSEIRRMYGPEVELFFIIGMDAFLEIKTWERYEDLFKETNFAVIKRPGVPDEQFGSLIMSMNMGFQPGEEAGSFILPSTGQGIFYKKMALLDISSTMIREKAAGGRSIRFLLPESVESYIKEKGLYKNGNS
jgi:nicotinate-nucleotide adenylyltransferase